MTVGEASELPPAQAAFRLLIELVAIVCWGIVGWNLTDGAARWALVLLLPTLAAAIWAVFRVPGDHSSGGGAPVPVPGIARLVIEIGVLLGAAICTAIVWQWTVGVALGVAVLVHSVTTLPRVRWMLGQRP